MNITGINHRSLAAEIMRELGIPEKCIVKFEKTGDIVYCNSSGFTCVSDIMDEQLRNTIAAEMRDWLPWRSSDTVYAIIDSEDGIKSYLFISEANAETALRNIEEDKPTLHNILRKDEDGDHELRVRRTHNPSGVGYGPAWFRKENGILKRVA